MKSFSAIIQAFGSDRDAAAAIGCKDYQARDWRLRDKIPSGWWNATVRAAEREDVPVSLEQLAHLAEMAERRLSDGRAA